MSTADIVGFTYLGGLALLTAVGVIVGAWEGVQRYDTKERKLEKSIEALMDRFTVGFVAGVLWPLTIVAALVAGPAWHHKKKAEQEKENRLTLASNLREAANMYSVGSQEYEVLVRAAKEASEVAAA